MVNHESQELVLEDLRGRIDEILYDIRRDLFEETRRIEGETNSWIDNLARKFVELEKRIQEWESAVDQISKDTHDFKEEVKDRLTRLETLSFMGSLVKLVNKAQKTGIEPEELFEEALRILAKVKGRRIGT